MNSVALDVIIFAHLFFVALGLGTAARLDIRIFMSRNAPIRRRDISDLENAHHLILGALAGLWITGLALIYIRTGFDPALVTPKVWTKLIVVTLLSLNAVVIGKFAMPIFAAHLGKAPISISTRLKIPMTICASLSGLCWFSALALGASAFLKGQSWEFFSLLLLAELGLCAALTALIVLISHGGTQRGESVTSRAALRGAPDLERAAVHS